VHPMAYEGVAVYNLIGIVLFLIGADLMKRSIFKRMPKAA
jgi:hypothetical protein